MLSVRFTRRHTDADIAQLVERILGKDEVSSSNLDSSSKGKHLEVLGLRGVFLRFFQGRRTVASYCLWKPPKIERLFLPVRQLKLPPNCYIINIIMKYGTVLRVPYYFWRFCIMARFTLPRDLYHGKGALEALKSVFSE